jgi:hypothetical protein
MRRVLVLLMLCACGPKTATTTRTQNATPDASPTGATDPTTATTTSDETTATTADVSTSSPVEPALVTPETDPKKIVGYARVPKQNEDFRAEVIVASIETSKADERVLWTIGLREDPFAKASPPKKFTLRVELPPQIALPIAKSDRIKVDLDAYGGGPNRRFALLVTGDKSVPIIAIDKLPMDWDTAKGKKLSMEKGEPYDAVTYAVKLGPKGKQVNLDGETWRSVTIDGVTYVGTATTVERKLHKRKMAPPDYVGGWTDFTLIRVP